MESGIIDVFNHCLPPRFVDACLSRMREPLVMFERAIELPGMGDLAERLAIMDAFPDYRQILSLASPTVEAIAGPNQSPDLARIGNDALAEWCAEEPVRFPGFIASLPMNHPAAALKETRRAIEELGALGVQLYTSINGAPIDTPEVLEIFGLMADLDRPIWLHPLRPSTVADYPGEEVSKYDLWWAFGWPHETSICAGRLVFAGVFDRWPHLKIITHHAGGTIPMMEALQAYTLFGAYLSFEEDVKGSIEPGKFADLIVLDQDLLTVDPETIMDTKVLQTWLGGRLVYEYAGEE